MAISLLQLRTRSRYRADMFDDDFISDAELNTYVNSSLGELYDILVATYGEDNFVEESTFNTVASTQDYNLPSDFYKLVGLDMTVGSTVYSLPRFNFSDRNLYRNSSVDIVGIDGVPKIRYRVVDEELRLAPAPPDAYACSMWYIPQVTELVADGDTINATIVDSWHEFVVVDAAIKMLIKEESDVGALMAQKQALMGRITSSAQRDIATPEAQHDSSPTLFNLRIQSRYKANVVDSSIVSDVELNHYINQSLGEIYDLLTKAYSDEYFVDGYSFTTASDQADYILPDNFYKMAGIDLVSSQNSYSLDRFNFNERNTYDNQSAYSIYGIPYFKYRILNNYIKLVPKPSGANSMKLWYIPRLTLLTLDTDTPNSNIIESWLEYVLIDVAIKIITKGSTSSPQVTTALGALTQQKAAMRMRIDEMSAMRDFGKPEVTTDVYVNDFNNGGWGRSGW